MFNRKIPFALTPACVVTTLVVSVVALFAVLVDAVARMETFL
ncbi:MAG TPA: hypothetical protein VF851_06015 [Steroidobacteraceae bacterium]